MAGMDAVVAKPINVADLFAAIARVCGGQRADAEGRDSSGVSLLPSAAGAE